MNTKKTKYIYLCSIDWKWVLGGTPITVYHSIASLKRNTKYWKSCGIVKLKVEKDGVVLKSQFFNKTNMQGDND